MTFNESNRVGFAKCELWRIWSHRKNVQSTIFGVKIRNINLFWSQDSIFVPSNSHLVGMVAWAPGSLLHSFTAARRSFLVRVMSTLSFSVSSRMLGCGRVAVLGLSRDPNVFRIFFLRLRRGFDAFL